MNGPFEEEVFVKQPPEFEIKKQEMKVYKLKKAPYGLKQSPRRLMALCVRCVLTNAYVSMECMSNTQQIEAHY